ncbi:uncharacterized protein LOC143368072 [Andrena cerasifolii]|uniref:uncharacterized protein LOC143368072 n=1 Tax=Andrena cerasifolii TaxID=2819439 RepID=UPI00403768A6
MYKLLLTLTLVAFSSGVLCNVVPNLPDTANLSLDRMEIMNNNDNEISNITDSELLTIEEDDDVDYQSGRDVNGQPLDMLKVMKGCVDRVPRDDYAVVPSMGAYKLHKRSRKWNDARKSCMAEGGDGNYLYT